MILKIILTSLRIKASKTINNKQKFSTLIRLNCEICTAKQSHPFLCYVANWKASCGTFFASSRYLLWLQTSAPSIRNCRCTFVFVITHNTVFITPKLIRTLWDDHVGLAVVFSPLKQFQKQVVSSILEAFLTEAAVTKLPN